jgi:hypothetical protein
MSKKPFDILNVDKFIAENKTMSLIEKSFKLLGQEESLQVIKDFGSQVDVLGSFEKSLDTSKLIRKKVQVHGKNGQVFEGYRYVSQETGQPISTGKESKETTEFKSKKEKENKNIKNPQNKEQIENKNDTDFADKIKNIVEGSNKKSIRIKDLVGLGIYDPSFLMQMNPDANKGDIKYFMNQSGIDPKQFKDILTSNINIGLGNEKIDKDSPIYELQQNLKQKDLSKVLKDKKQERAEKLGITADDKFNAYRFKLDQLIGDRMTRSLIVYGTGGIGKSFNLQKKLEEYGKVGYDPELDLKASEYDYLTVTGNTSGTDLYNKLYENPKKLIIFDDCDSMWDDEGMQNILKGALDTTGSNIISYANPKKLADGTYPNKSFKFSGQCIFVSNLPREKFPQPLIDSRSNALDLTMSMDQTLDQLHKIEYDFKIKDADGNDLEIPKSDREDIVKVLDDLKGDLRVEQVNGRVLGNLAALKLGMNKRAKGAKVSYDEFKKQAMIALDLL